MENATMAEKQYKCVQCGEPFEGTGKPGRPYQHCPSCRGLTPVILGGDQALAIRHSTEPGVWAYVSIKDGRGTREARLTHKQLLEHLSKILLVIQERERRKEK